MASHHACTWCRIGVHAAVGSSSRCPVRAATSPALRAMSHADTPQGIQVPSGALPSVPSGALPSVPSGALTAAGDGEGAAASDSGLGPLTADGDIDLIEFVVVGLDAYPSPPQVHALLDEAPPASLVCMLLVF